MTVESIQAEFLRYQTLTDRALEQLPDTFFNVPLFEDGNSIATLLWHLSCNLKSRYTDFLVEGVDGEKSWRNHAAEFYPREYNRAQLMKELTESYSCLRIALAKLVEADLHRTVVIRGVTLPVHAALHRSLAHYTYHVGQIVLLARYFTKDRWEKLTVLSGGVGADSEKNASVKW